MSTTAPNEDARRCIKIARDEAERCRKESAARELFYESEGRIGSTRAADNWASKAEAADFVADLIAAEFRL
jgi:hypothetical protein